MVIKLTGDAPIDEVVRELNIFLLDRKYFKDFILIEVSELDGYIIKEALGEFIQIL